MEIERFDLLYYENHYQDGRCTMKVEDAVMCLSESTDKYIMELVPDDHNPLCKRKVFDAATLCLASEGMYLAKSILKVGVWKDYDTDGNVVNQTDYDVDYPLKWEQVASILKAEGVGYDDIKVIHRSVNQDRKPQWNFMILRNSDTIENVIIDAVDGTIIEWDKKRSKSEYRPTNQ